MNFLQQVHSSFHAFVGKDLKTLFNPTACVCLAVGLKPKKGHNTGLKVFIDVFLVYTCYDVKGKNWNH